MLPGPLRFVVVEKRHGIVEVGQEITVEVKGLGTQRGQVFAIVRLARKQTKMHFFQNFLTMPPLS